LIKATLKVVLLPYGATSFAIDGMAASAGTAAGLHGQGPEPSVHRARQSYSVSN
jgi:hypothetical protein